MDVTSNTSVVITLTRLLGGTCGTYGIYEKFVKTVFETIQRKRLLTSGTNK
jgi:hypothetical protein